MAFVAPLPTLARPSFFAPISIDKVQVHPVTVPHVHPRHRSRALGVPRMAAGSGAAAGVGTTSTDAILNATNLSKTHDGAHYLFREQSLSVHRGDKILILGPNGSGKTSLLHILAGVSTPDTGNVSLRKGTVCALVSQSLPSNVPADLPVTSAVLFLASMHSPTPAVRAAERHARALQALTETSGDVKNDDNTALKKLASAAAEMDRCPGAWEVDSRVSGALVTLGLPADALLGTLSGGQKRRVGIAAAIAARPDILFLDEVTNHLSFDGIEFLETFLADPSLTVVAISHDRAFIDAVCTTAIWELESGTVSKFSPAYDVYLSEKAALLDGAQRRDDAMRKALSKELEWLRRQPKARSTKNKARVDDALALQQNVRDGKARAQARALRVQPLAAESARLGGQVVSLTQLTVRRGDRDVVRDFSYAFQRAERVGLVGPNGMGKSSLLKAIAGLPGVDVAGDRSVGDTVVFGYFDQEGIDLTARLSQGSAAMRGVSVVEDLRVVDYAAELIAEYGVPATPATPAVPTSAPPQQSKRRNAPEPPSEQERRVASELERLSYSGAHLARARSASSSGRSSTLAKMSPIQLLDYFGFARAKQHDFVRHLSGGERRRLQLIALLLRAPNFLILDEISNDLDVNTLTIVEEVLEQYAGVLILCSHDRFMLDRLVDHLLVMEGDGQVNVVQGRFSEYLSDRRAAREEEKRAKRNAAEMGGRKENGTAKDTAKKMTKKKLSYKEKKEYEGLEDEIKQLEAEHEDLCQKIAAPDQASAGYEVLQQWTERLAAIEQEIDEKTERWMELEEVVSA